MTTTVRTTSPPGVPRRRPSTHTAKVVMAATGLVLGAFVLVHLVGNLKVWSGAASLDEYARWLRTVGEPLVPHEGVLWALRLVLSVCLVAHLWCAAVLWRRGRVARGGHRAPFRWRSFGARTMPVTGIAVLAFVVFHVLDLTTGHAAAEGFRETTTTEAHAYANLVASFERPAAALAYVVAMLVLALHLAHGVWMAAHDLGVTGTRTRTALKVTAGVLAILVLVGNASIPVAVQLGVLA